MIHQSLLAIGDIAADLLIHLPPKLAQASLRDILPPIYPGGTIGNTAVALARFGIPVTLASAIGHDGYGDFLKESLSAIGVDTSHVISLSNRFTLTVSVVIDRDGERYLAMYPQRGMASSYYPPDQVNSSWMQNVGWLHASGAPFWEGTTVDTVIAAMHAARAGGIPISFDMNLRPLAVELPRHFVENLWQAIRLSDYIFGSGIEEFSYLTNNPDPMAASRQLAQYGATVISRWGNQGCYVLSLENSPVHIPAFSTSVVDTLGAGDVFDAGFITAMLEGYDAVEAARWGNAAAALSIARTGAALHLTRESLDRLLTTDGNR